MEFHGRVTSPQREGDTDLRRGPWTIEEDLILMNYINNHGDGRWNALARCAGLKRTGKSCRLRWLNYLRPDVRRGDITPEEQLLILELHSRWGNRWSKIAQYLPGRTDNEIKNYWRTRVQKHAKQLKCDVNSQQFKDVMRYLWMPRLLERIQAASANKGAAAATTATACHKLPELMNMLPDAQNELGHPKPSPESYNMAGSSSEYSLGTPTSSPISVSDCFGTQVGDFKMKDTIQADQLCGWWPEMLPSPTGYCHLGLPDFDQSSSEGNNENLWSLDDIWSLQLQQ